MRDPWISGYFSGVVDHFAGSKHSLLPLLIVSHGCLTLHTYEQTLATAYLESYWATACGLWMCSIIPSFQAQMGWLAITTSAMGPPLSEKLTNRLESL